MRRLALVAMIVVAISPELAPSGLVRAQDEVIEDEIVEPLSVAAGELDNPRRFFVGEDGVLLIATAGHGGDRIAELPPIPDTPITGGRTASVLRIQDGCVDVLAPRLPSAVGATGRTWGAADVSISDGQLYVLVAGGGVAHGNPRIPNGVYRIGSTGAIELIADLSAWLRANPVAALKPLNQDPDGLPTAMTVVGEDLWVVEANGGQVLRVDVGGEISRVVDLSASHLILTDIIPSPSGGAFVATSGTMPALDRTAKVMEITPAGDVTDVWIGLTAVVGLALDLNQTLYALETSSGNSIAPPYQTHRTGRVLRQIGPNAHEVLVRRLDLPISMSGGLDGFLYVAVPGVGKDDATILRIDPTTAVDLTFPSSPLAGPLCGESAG